MVSVVVMLPLVNAVLRRVLQPWFHHLQVVVAAAVGKQPTSNTSLIQKQVGNGEVEGFCIFFSLKKVVICYYFPTSMSITRFFLHWTSYYLLNSDLSFIVSDRRSLAFKVLIIYLHSFTIGHKFLFRTGKVSFDKKEILQWGKGHLVGVVKRWMDDPHYTYVEKVYGG